MCPAFLLVEVTERPEHDMSRASLENVRKPNVRFA